VRIPHKAVFNIVHSIEYNLLFSPKFIAGFKIEENRIQVEFLFAE
jgi:hypothetical protein